MKYLVFIVGTILIFIACSPEFKFSQDKKAFEASKTISSFKAVADMNDSYFELKENNFFEFYRELFDSVKNTRYPGTYVISNDTLHLKFYNKKGEKLLGTKAVIHPDKKQILFFP